MKRDTRQRGGRNHSYNPKRYRNPDAGRGDRKRCNILTQHLLPPTPDVGALIVFFRLRVVSLLTQLHHSLWVCRPFHGLGIPFACGSPTARQTSIWRFVKAIFFNCRSNNSPIVTGTRPNCQGDPAYREDSSSSRVPKLSTKPDKLEFEKHRLLC